MRRKDLCPAIVAALSRYPAPHDHHYGVIPPPPPEDSLGLPKTVATHHRRALEALARARDIFGNRADSFRVSRVLIRREAVNSSTIEGTHSTLDALLAIEMIHEDAAPVDRQVLSYAIALEQALRVVRVKRAACLTSGLVRTLHRRVVAGDPGYRGEPGAWRKTVVWIGGPGDIALSTYNPAPPDAIPGCVRDHVAYLRCEGPHQQTQSLIVRMAVAHAHFEAIHPFIDGNGRVGRLLLPLMMAADREVPLPLSPYIEAHKDDYYAALKAAQQRLDWPTMIGFMAKAIGATVEETLVTETGLTRLQEVWRGQATFRAKSAAERALEILPDSPVITVARLAELLGVSVPTANNAVTRLMDAGILSEVTGHRRNRLFQARDALRIINRPFGSEPLLPGDAA